MTKKAKKNVKKLDKQIAQRLQKKLDYFLNSGKPLDYAQTLTKPADASYRWRVGDFRILFDFNENTKTIIILKIQHRREVYRN